jgi:hypothetical protein
MHIPKHARRSLARSAGGQDLDSRIQQNTSVLKVGLMALGVLLAVGVVMHLRAASASAVVGDPSVVGQFSPMKNMPVSVVTANVMPNGRVLFWPAWDTGAQVQLWDPPSDSVSAGTSPSFDPFCAGQVFMADGRLFVTGGHVPGGGVGSGDTGLTEASYYDPASNSWQTLPTMNAGRWYPTNTILGSGDVLTTSGHINTASGNNPLPQVWQAASGTWRNLTSAQQVMDTYPFMFLAPNGKVFHAGSEQTTQYLDTSGTGAWSTVGDRTWGQRGYGTAVMYDTGKVLTLGLPPLRSST